MKQSELTKIVGDKLDDETKQKVLDAINADTNSIVSERDEKIKTLKDENATLKTSADMYAKEKEKYTSDLTQATAQNDFLSKKNFIYKNVNNTLEDEDVKDLITLAGTREGKFEDVVVDIAKKRNFIGGAASTAELAPAPRPSSSIANNDGATDKLSKDDTMSWLFGNKKK